MDNQSVEALLVEYQQTHNPALLDKLTRRHLYIASIVAKRFSGRGVEYDDLYQVASLALLKAIERFDPNKGVRFVTFATPTMMGEVKNYFRDKSRLIQLPRRATVLGKRLDEARETLEQQLSRAPTPVELAEAVDMPLDSVLETLEARAATSVTSLSATPTEAEDAELSDFLGINEAGYEVFEQRDAVTRALAFLPDDEQRVIRARFFDGKSQRQVADILGVSQMTISRTERRALLSLRGLLKE